MDQNVIFSENLVDLCLRWKRYYFRHMTVDSQVLAKEQSKKK